jgi:hypothetical protein
LYVAVGAAVIVTALVTDGRENVLVAGASGGSYEIPAQNKVWRAVGPVLSVRFHTDHSNASAIAAEAADLLPYFSAKADSSGLRYLVLRAYKPVWQLGGLGVYRGWNFRYERTDQGWASSGYW